MLVGYLTGTTPVVGHTPKPDCSYAWLAARWSLEPMPTDEFAKREVAASRIAELSSCTLQWDAWYAENFPVDGEIEVG